MRTIVLILLTGCGLINEPSTQIDEESDRFDDRTLDADLEPQQDPNSILLHCMDQKVELEQQLVTCQTETIAALGAKMELVAPLEQKFMKAATTKQAAGELMDGCLSFFDQCRFTIIDGKLRADFDVSMDPRSKDTLAMFNHQFEAAPDNSTYEVTGFIMP